MVRALVGDSTMTRVDILACKVRDDQNNEICYQITKVLQQFCDLKTKPSMGFPIRQGLRRLLIWDESYGSNVTRSPESSLYILYTMLLAKLATD